DPRRTVALGVGEQVSQVDVREPRAGQDDSAVREPKAGEGGHGRKMAMGADARKLSRWAMGDGRWAWNSKGDGFFSVALCRSAQRPTPNAHRPSLRGMLLQLRFDRGARHRADDLIHDLAALEEQHRRDGAHVEAR